MSEIPRHEEESTQEGGFEVSDWDKQYLAAQRERLQSETLPEKKQKEEENTAKARNAIIRGAGKKEKAK